MPSSKITQLPLITKINANTSNTLFVGVDVPTLSTGQLTVHTLAQGLYSNEVLNVGTNQQNLPNTVAQFSASGESYIQTNLVNTNDDGSADIVVTANTGSDSTYFIDMGYANKNYQPGVDFNNIGTAVNPLDGYIYAQGINSSVPGGNLIVGSTTSGREVRFVAGGGSSSNVIAKMTANGLYMMNGMPVYFSDGVAQYNAAASLAYTQAAYALANTTSNTVAYQTGVDTSQNTSIQAAFNKANSAVQNTAIVQLQALTLTGNLIANSAGQGIFVDKFTSNSATFSQNLVVFGNLTSNTLLGNIFFSNVTTTTTQSNSILWTAQAGAVQQQTAQLWYYGNTQSLILDTDIVGDRLSISKVLFFRGFNSTGATIPANSFIRLTTGVTANQIPYIALADATNSANSTVAGFVKVAIANGAFGFAYSQGIVEDFNTTGLGSNGDILFLSTTPGVASNVAPTGVANTVVQLGKIILSDATQGKLFIQNQLRQAYGRPNGSVLYAYANNITSSNTISINDSTGTFTANTIVANTLISITDFVSGNVTANTVIANNIIQYNAAVNNNTVTQLTSKSTTVTSNGRTGQITTNGAALNKGVAVQFTVNNSYIVSNKDVVILNIASGASVGYGISVNNVTPGSFQVNLHNSDSTPSGSNASDTLVINYAIIRVN